MCEAGGLSANALSTAGDSGRKASTASVAKKFLEPLRRQRGIARRVLNVAVTEIGLDSARIVAIVGELVIGLRKIVELEKSARHPYRRDVSMFRLAVPSLRENFLC
jgi:hypothetical protein